MSGTDRTDELETLMAMADVIGVPPAETALPRAGSYIRRGAFEPGLAANDPASDPGNCGMRAVLIGDYAAVFAAVVNMGPPSAAAAAAWMRERHGRMIARLVRTTTPRWYDNWSAAAFSPRRPPPSLLSAGDPGELPQVCRSAISIFG